MTKKKMITAVFNGPRKIDLEECDLPLVSSGKILIRVEACAICTWEQRVFTGVKMVEYPFIGGHEIAGEIVETGENVDMRQWKIGDKVVYGTNLACGNCYQCKTGNEQNCQYFDHSKHLEGLPYKGMGGFSQYLLAEPEHVFKYRGVSPLKAAFSEPLSCVIHSCETADIQYGDTVVVIGCGIMGLLHIQMAVKSGAVVIASDMNEERLDMAERFGAKYTLNPQTVNVCERILELTESIGAQVVFDTTPISKVAEEAIDFLSINGKLILYSSFYPDLPVIFSPDKLHKKAFRIMGTANSNSPDFIKAAKLISNQVIEVDSFISQVYPLNEIQKAMESAVKGDKYRVLIDFNKS